MSGVRMRSRVEMRRRCVFSPVDLLHCRGVYFPPVVADLQCINPPPQNACTLSEQSNVCMSAAEL